MKKLLNKLGNRTAYIIIGFVLAIAGGVYAVGPVTPTTGGGTGTSTAPTVGQVLVGLSNGTYAPQATTTLGIVGTGGSGNTTWTIGNGLIYNGTNISSTTGNSVLIGTTTPTTANLHVVSTTTKSSVFTASSSTGATLFNILSNGNIGVGIVNPQSLLTVSRQATIQIPVSGSTAQFVGLDANPLRVTYDTHNNANTSGTALMFRRSRGTSATPLADVLDDVLGSLNFRGYGATGYAAGSTALMTAKSEGTFTDTSMPTAITFDTTPTSSVTAVERFRITGNGRVGIATTTPLALLHVASASTTLSTMAVQATTSQISAVFDVWSSVGNTLFNVQPGGNVGIGSSSPTALLTLQGTAGSTTDLLRVASSTGSSILTVTSSSTAPTLLVTGGATSGTILQVASSTGANLFTIAANGHIIYNQTAAPGLSGAGTGGVFQGTATDQAGLIKVGTGSVTSITVTFVVPYSNIPTCIANESAAGIANPAVSTTPTTLIITNSGSMASSWVNYLCFGLAGTQ